MQCEKCHDPIESGEEREIHGRMLCEDCYMDTLSPTRTCDPWAVHSAKSLIKEQGGAASLTPIQQKILKILEDSGGLEPMELAKRMQMKPGDMEREIAALRHMEKIRGELKEGRRTIRLW